MNSSGIQTVLDENGTITSVIVPIDIWRYRQSTSPSRESSYSKKLTAFELLQSELIGIWADRTDIGDSLLYARQLRQQAETHRWNPDNVS